MFVYITSLVTVLAIVGGCIGIYKLYYSLPKNISPKLKGGIIGVIIVLVIIFTTIVANLQNTVQFLTVSPQGKTALPTLARLVSPTAITTPTATSTPIPTPSPTPLPKPGTVLYQASTLSDWNLWALSADWKVIGYNNLLINDGSSRLGVPGGGPTAVAPYNVSRTLNFAVEVRIKSSPPNSGWAFGINVCGSSDQGSWTGYIAYIINNGGVLALIRYPQHEVSQNFDPGTTWHTYRVEVRANSIALLIDGATIATATDATYLTCGEQVGLWSDLIPISVSSFKVIAL